MKQSLVDALNDARTAVVDRLVCADVDLNRIGFVGSTEGRPVVGVLVNAKPAALIMTAQYTYPENPNGIAVRWLSDWRHLNVSTCLCRSAYQCSTCTRYECSTCGLEMPRRDEYQVKTIGGHECGCCRVERMSHEGRVVVPRSHREVGREKDAVR